MEIKSTDLKITTVSDKENKGIFNIEPLPNGLGHTIGNSLRRVLLTSIKGAAITQLKLTGAEHQFSTIQGVKEDVVELTLNLKKVRLKLHSKDPVVVTIEKKGPGEVRAEDIKGTSDVEILNKDLHIAHLADKNTLFKAELIVEPGTGYSPMEERQSSKIGVIVLDAIFSPIIRVNYTVEETRFGKVTDLDKITLSVDTDGSISPTNAVKNSAYILSDLFTKIAEWSLEDKTTAVIHQEVVSKTKVKTNILENTPVDELPLQTRTINALKKHGVITFEQLSSKADNELSDIKNLGEKSISEITKLLKKEGLR